MMMMMIPSIIGVQCFYVQHKNHMVMEEALLEPRLWGDETNSSEKISSHRAELQVRSRFQNNNTVKD